MVSASSSSPSGSTDKSPWHLPPESRLQIQCNSDGQPVGPNARKLSTSYGEVARMGNFFSILYDNWKHVPETGKEDAWDYLNEHYSIPDSLKDYVMESINHCWRNHKTRLRRILDECIKTVSYETIRAVPPEEVERSQWREFVRRYFDPKEKWVDRKKKGQDTRSNLKDLHTCGRTSYAQKRKELEEKKGGPITALTFYQMTHTKKDETMNEYSINIVEKCREVIAVKSSQGLENNTTLEEEALRAVRGPEHSGRVRGAGRGVTMTSMKWRYDARANLETQKHREEIEYLKKAMEEKDKAIKAMQEQLQEKDIAFKAIQEHFQEKNAEFSTMQQQIQLLMQMQGLQGAPWGRTRSRSGGKRRR